MGDVRPDNQESHLSAKLWTMHAPRESSVGQTVNHACPTRVICWPNYEPCMPPDVQSMPWRRKPSSPRGSLSSPLSTPTSPRQAVSSLIKEYRKEKKRKKSSVFSSNPRVGWFSWILGENQLHTQIYKMLFRGKRLLNSIQNMCVNYLCFCFTLPINHVGNVMESICTGLLGVQIRIQILPLLSKSNNQFPHLKGTGILPWYSALLEQASCIFLHISSQYNEGISFCPWKTRVADLECFGPYRPKYGMLFFFWLNF